VARVQTVGERPAADRSENIALMLNFVVEALDPSSCARCGQLSTPHGEVLTPAFMPVGTQGSVKGLEVDQIRATGSQILLANTYHLAIRPGADVVARLGGLHRFMGWDGPILTDSGGFQILSLAQSTRVREEYVEFRAHTNGSLIQLSPERVMAIQAQLGSDIAMVLDHVVPLPNDRQTVRDACERTVRWARRSRLPHAPTDQATFAIVQGGLDETLRVACAQALVELGFDGYAIGGLSVGERMEERNRIVAATCTVLPAHRPRYLMGVGRPADLLDGIRLGIDLFDCVMPTRTGRNALAFTDSGPLRLRNRMYHEDDRPIDADCPCVACRRSRGYLRHLFLSGEMLGPILVSIHNLTYYQGLMAQARRAIHEGEYLRFYQRRREKWSTGRGDVRGPFRTG
jgi:queuine tRNA-ribosyltransferase